MKGLEEIKAENAQAGGAEVFGENRSLHFPSVKHDLSFTCFVLTNIATGDTLGVSAASYAGAALSVLRELYGVMEPEEHSANAA